MQEHDTYFLRKAINLAEEGMRQNSGGPFGAVVVKEGMVVAEAYNAVTSTKDPTAHAEMVAIREACKSLDSFQLTGCTLYTSCEPCPMCLGAIYWARLDRVVYAADRTDAAVIHFDDEFIYEEIDKKIADRSVPFEQSLRDEAVEVFRKWDRKKDKIDY